MKLILSTLLLLNIGMFLLKAETKKDNTDYIIEAIRKLDNICKDTHLAILKDKQEFEALSKLYDNMSNESVVAKIKGLSFKQQLILYYSIKATLKPQNFIDFAEQLTESYFKNKKSVSEKVIFMFINSEVFLCNYHNIKVRRILAHAIKDFKKTGKNHEANICKNILTGNSFIKYLRNWVNIPHGERLDISKYFIGDIAQIKYDLPTLFSAIIIGKKALDYLKTNKKINLQTVLNLACKYKVSQKDLKVFYSKSPGPAKTQSEMQERLIKIVAYHNWAKEKIKKIADNSKIPSDLKLIITDMLKL